MKYVYGTLAVLGILIGFLKLIVPSVGQAMDALLWLIFGAVCAVAAEISEIGDRIEKPKSPTQEAPRD